MTTRREFVAGLGMVAAGMTSRMQAKPPTPGEHRPLRVGLVGIGGYARVVAPRALASREAKITAFFTGNKEGTSKVASELGVAETVKVLGYEDLAAAAGRDVDAVHICLPVGLHYEFSKRALDAGLHVLCEKPLAARSADARALIQHATNQGLVLMPAYRARYSAHIREVERRLKEGAVGPVRLIDAHKGFAMTQPKGNWRFDPELAGSGCITDIGIYSIQLSRWFAGRHPTHVTAMQSPGHDDDRFALVESHVAWMLEFGDRMLATGSASWKYRLQNHARVMTERGSFLLEPATPVIGERLLLGLDAPSRTEEIHLPIADQIPLMYDDFAKLALDDASAGVPAVEGVADILVIEAMLRSLKSGRPEPVEAVDPEQKK